MRGTELFKQTIKEYLDKKAREDELFRAKYATTTRSIDDVVTYIGHTVFASGCGGFNDEEIFKMATNVIEEPELEIGGPIHFQVINNHHIELTEEEKAEQKAIVLKRFQEEEYRKLQMRNSKPKAVKPKQPIQSTRSLFDEF